MVTEEGARTQPSGDDPVPRLGRATSRSRWRSSSCNGSPTDLAMRQPLQHPAEPQLWHRATFHRILSGLGVLNFASIKSDVAYLIPRDVGWGLTREDLAQPKFQYLRPIV